MGFASSLEFMTMQMREVMIDSWGTAAELDEEDDSAATATTAVEGDDEMLAESDTETEHQDHSVQSDCDEGCWRLLWPPYVIGGPVSYTHLTLPTNREV